MMIVHPQEYGFWRERAERLDFATYMKRYEWAEEIMAIQQEGHALLEETIRRQRMFEAQEIPKRRHWWHLGRRRP
jgi:hypothetical protein